MARKKVSTQQHELHAEDTATAKNSYTEAADEVDTKDKLRDWFTRGVVDARTYLAQSAGKTLSMGYNYNETLWWIGIKYSEQAMIEYKRGFASLVKL